MYPNPLCFVWDKRDLVVFVVLLRGLPSCGLQERLEALVTDSYQGCFWGFSWRTTHKVVGGDRLRPHPTPLISD